MNLQSTWVNKIFPSDLGFDIKGCWRKLLTVLHYSFGEFDFYIENKMESKSIRIHFN